jgi:hypothetical protein
MKSKIEVISATKFTTKSVDHEEIHHIRHNFTAEKFTARLFTSDLPQESSPYFIKNCSPQGQLFHLKFTAGAKANHLEQFTATKNKLLCGERI